ncbi:MAG: bifunctional DNA-formamidopyrimidine glycosylase/DNA-(apurinic or apyrimidinic site) lyase [Endozoicomonas sp. (ex Botrylloides leachii)]|nr:bifunctional DNA-formamidopyrimidine glycosylase/DNA-(apurinic or apyrimidinic site) lyase [Endozoicomonas sp. (ex Botrylloides leachii)]
MPELPEVETTLRGITPHIIGHPFREVVVRQKQLRWPIPDNLNELLAGYTIHQIRRRAKYLLLETKNGSLIIHLGMSGCLRIVDPSDLPVEKHDHVDFVVSDSLSMRYTDPRRFGAILWTSKPAIEHKLLEALGPEPLTDDFSGEGLFMLSRGRKQAIKHFIMDNHIVVGVGNIYANEALFKAGIRPDRSSGSLSYKRYQLLVDAIKETLAQAIEQGGTTLKDFVGGDSKPGYFKQKLTVYGRKGKPCKRCNNIIVEIRQRNRATFFCNYCQG